MIAVEILVVVSWVSYCIPHENYSGRLSPLVVVLLALVNILLRTYTDVPDLGYLAAFEVYIMSNILQVAFVIGLYGYILVRMKLLHSKNTATVVNADDNDLYTKHQCKNIARKTDNFGVCLSVSLNLFCLICYVILFALQ